VYTNDFTKVKATGNDALAPRPVLNYASNLFKVSNLMLESKGANASVDLGDQITLSQIHQI